MGLFMVNALLRRRGQALVVVSLDRPDGPMCRHTPVDVAEAVRQLVAGEVPVDHLITARLPMSELRTALEMVADRTTLRTILVPDHP